jgi:hypothetical protein
MVKNPVIFYRQNLAFLRHVLPDSLLEDCWEDFQRTLVDKSGFSPVNIIIPPWLFIFIYHLGDEQ